MKIKRENIDLSAPAGSFESLMAAIQGGADSVYFGLEKLNMRARSSYNFRKEDLSEIIDICSKHGIKTYFTANIVFYDDEIPQIKELIDFTKKAGVTAVIASDQAIINYAHSIGMSVHISTQVNISNVESLKFYAGYADVMILARELNLKQISSIADQVRKQNIKGPSGELVKLELFIHGALCMSISGKCYLSLHEHNYSANRGECLQDCRRAYTVTEKETGFELDVENEYIMSPKDLCTIHFLNKILDAGISVLKIEGRARPPEYVKIVTECYNEAINSYMDGNYTRDKIKNWKGKLAAVFNRGFWDGYYLGQKLGEWSDVYGSKATKKKIYVGKGMNYFDRIKVAEFICEAEPLDVGDEILIAGPTTGVIHGIIKEIRVDLKNVGTAKQGERFSIPLDYTVRRSDKLFKIVDSNKKAGK
jgi:putative protease